MTEACSISQCQDSKPALLPATASLASSFLTPVACLRGRFLTILFLDDMEEYFSGSSLTAGDEEICPLLGTLRKPLERPTTPGKKRTSRFKRDLFIELGRRLGLSVDRGGYGLVFSIEVVDENNEGVRDFVIEFDAHFVEPLIDVFHPFDFSAHPDDLLGF
jgi:hypothetical protein